MATIHEISKVKNINSLWVVMILSAATGQWIVQGEWNTKAQAEADRKNWLQ